MPASFFARYPISRQTLVVLIHAAAITVALPLTLVLRENRLPAGDHFSDCKRTPFLGRLLRRTRLDELPQLWNELIDDLAIIGPRPLVAADHASLALNLRILGRTIAMMLLGERRDPFAICTARAALVPQTVGPAE